MIFPRFEHDTTDADSLPEGQESYPTMAGPGADPNPGFWISRVHTRLTHIVRQRTRVELGITGQQGWILFLLASGRCGSPSAIAKECGIDLSAATRILDRMEKRGLLQRIRSTKDRRLVHIQLTESGNLLAARVPQIVDSVFQHAQAGLTAAEIGFLESLLRRIHLNCA
jgi:DNA-binding MarR family transcriptional regulator